MRGGSDPTFHRGIISWGADHGNRSFTQFVFCHSKATQWVNMRSGQLTRQLTRLGIDYRWEYAHEFEPLRRTTLLPSRFLRLLGGCAGILATESLSDELFVVGRREGQPFVPMSSLTPLVHLSVIALAPH